MNYKKYQKMYHPIPLEDRQWPNNEITHAPIWCSVDLRDGNQALYSPMTTEEKIEFFKFLVKLGFKEIEVGFPAASHTEFEFVRRLIDENLIPDDVTIQVLTQAREHIIKKTVEALKGAKNAIIHLYNSTSTLQREVVFRKSKEEIKQLAVDGAKLVMSLVDGQLDGNIRFEYSPESFTCTEPDYAAEVTNAVLDVFKPSETNKVIVNLPSTIEVATANVYADQIEYMCKHLNNREHLVISVHAHNDRGTGVASSELALLAGAERVEGTLFGNGERTGNMDIVTMGLNMFTQGVDPKLDFSNLPKLREIYERCTNMKIDPRQPYIGELVFTAFSGSHQDAINKGMKYMKESGTEYWEIPYLPIDPADVGREYEPIIRINSQSGKGGAAFVMNNNFGYDLPKRMHPEFSKLVQAKCEELGRELIPKELFEVFEKNYLEHKQKYVLSSRKIYEESENGNDYVHFKGKMKINGNEEVSLSGVGNGPIDAFFNAIKKVGLDRYEFISYSQHAISQGSDSKAVSYIELKKPDGKNIFGIGIDSNVNVASVLGVLNAINRAEA